MLGDCLKHEERMKLASDLTKKIVDSYGENVLFIGVYGSTARAEDKEFSDLELLVIMKHPAKSKMFIYKDIVVLIHFITHENALKNLGDVTGPWWLGWVGTLLYTKRLYGEEKLLDKFRNIVNSISDKKYAEAAANSLVWTYEFFNQIRNAYQNGDLYSAMSSALYLRNSIGEFTAFLNKKHYRSHVFRSLNEAKQFEKLPKNYFNLMQKLGTSNNLEEIYETANKLWKGCLKLARENNIKIKRYSSIDKIEITEH